jgi:hypothetical protein
MTATWYLVKHVPDLRRREPRNVGLLLKTPEGWLTRFVGEGTNGSIDGRKLPHSTINTEVYKTWVDYFRRKASDDGWSDVERMQRRKGSNYVAELGGHLIEEQASWDDVLNRLYADLVDTDQSRRESRETPLDHLLNGVEHVFGAAGIVAEREVRVDAQFDPGGVLTTVPFRFSFVNGQQHLMDVVHEHVKLEQAAAEARELRARVDAARLAGVARSFVAFYASSIVPAEEIDQILLPVEEVSHVVDVDRPDDAVDTMQELAAH